MLEQEQSEFDAALAAFGLVAERAPVAAEPLFLWPENIPSWNLFQAVGTQWVVGPNGPAGLNYQGVEVVMRKWRIKRRDEQRVFFEIQMMERATLLAWAERKNA